MEGIEQGSPEHEAALELRRRVLREPLGLSDFAPNEWELEARAIALGCFLIGREPERAVLVGTLLLQPGATASPAPADPARGNPTQSNPVLGNAVRMRQVAVEPAWQGRGVGRLLVEAAEEWCHANGAQDVFAHARASAVPFYEHLGYVTFGETFVEVGLPHRLVTKRLGAASNHPLRVGEPE